MKTVLLSLALTLLIGCGTNTIEVVSSPITYDSYGCVEATSFGAIPDDGKDDREALQKAIDAGQASDKRCLSFPPGEYHVTRKDLVGVTNIPSLKVTSTLAMRPETAGSVRISMLGSAILTGKTTPTDWTLLSITAENSSVKGLIFDGSARTGTNEQTHLIQVNGGSYRVSIASNEFILPAIGPSSGGDCIRLLGSPTAWVDHVDINGNKATNCDRSFVGVQRGVSALTIVGNTSLVVGDQVVDFEPTGGSAFNCFPIVKDVYIGHNDFKRSKDKGSVIISISGDGCAVADEIELDSNLLEPGVIFIIDVGRVTIRNMEIMGKPGDSDAPIHALKRIGDLRIINSTISRQPESPPGPTIKIHEQSGAVPTRLFIEDSTILHQGDGTIITAESLKGLLVVSSNLVHIGTTIPDAIVARGINSPAGTPVVVDSVISGVTNAARMAGLKDPVPPAIIRTSVGN